MHARKLLPLAALLVAAIIVAGATGDAFAQTAVSLNNSSFTYDNSGQSGPHTEARGTLSVAGSRNTVTLVRSQPYDVTLSFSNWSAGASENGRAINFVLGGTPGVNGVDSKIVLATQTEYRFRSINAAYFNGGEFAVYDMAGGGGANGFVRGIRYGIDANSRTSAAGATVASNAISSGGSIFSQEVTGPISAQTTLTIGSTATSADSGTLRIVGPSNITLASGATLTVANASNGGSFGVLKTGGGTAVISGGTGFGVNGNAQSTWRVDAVDDVLALDTPLTGFSAITRFFIDGQGTLSLRQNITWANDHRNYMRISAGTLEIGGNAQHTRENTGGSATIFSLEASTATFHYASTNTASTNGAPIGGAGQVLVSNGRITFQGTRANTYTGPTTVVGGTLGLNYASNVSRIADTAQLRLGGGTVELIDGTSTEIVGSTALVGGLGRIIRSSGTSVLRLNTVTPGTGFVDFGGDGIAQVDNANTNGILGPWATVAGTDWAVNSTGGGDGPVTAYTGYTDIAALGSTLPDGATANVRIAGDGAGGAITIGAATTTVHTLLQGNGTTAATIDTAAGTLAVSGVMVGSGRQPLTIGVAVGDGSLQSANSTANLTLANFGSAGPLTVNAPIAANGSAGLVTAGNVVLDGNSSYTGPTVVNAGTLQLGTGGGTGSLSSETAISGPAGTRLAVNRSGTLTLGSASGGGITGGIGLSLDGGGRLVLAGTNSYTGGTEIEIGSTLQIGAGSATGSLSPTSAITNDGTLAFNRSGTLVQGVDFAAAISGFGGLVQEGPGTTRLTGVNTYFGSTTVSAGTLAVGPAGTINLTSDVLVTVGTFRYDNATTPLNQTVAFGGTGGTISGVGRIATDLVISSGNTISPGNSPGILGTGNLTWATGGNYNWQVLDAAAAAGVGGFDQVSVTGSLEIQSDFNLNLWSQDMVSDVIFNGDAIFDENVNQHWVIATTTGGLIGAENLATTSIFTDSRNGTTGFTNELAPGGSFSLVQGGGLSGTTSSDVVLVYAVPEPATLVLLAGAALAGLLASRARAGRRILAARPGRAGAARQ